MLRGLFRSMSLDGEVCGGHAEGNRISMNNLTKQSQENTEVFFAYYRGGHIFFVGVLIDWESCSD